MSVKDVPSNIFISYSKDDRERIQPLIRVLTEQGYKVFWDRTIPIGQTWRNYIATKIDDSEIFLLVWTRASVESKWVLEEADRAKGSGKIVLPVRLDDVPVPLGYSTYQAADLVDWKGDSSDRELKQLLRAMKGGAADGVETQTPHHQMAESSWWQRFSRLQISVILVVAVAVVAVSLIAYQYFTAPVFVPSYPDLVNLKAGCYMRGSPIEQRHSERPYREVCIQADFKISSTEVTFDQYLTYAQEEIRPMPDDEDWGRGSRPVIHVNYLDAQEYARWLSRQELPGADHCRLPTEAEWEYAARAAKDTDYGIGDGRNIRERDKANCKDCQKDWPRSTLPVKQFKANAWGLYDMHGNVWEWVQDCWRDNYDMAPVDGSAFEFDDSMQCGRRVIRGGSWEDSVDTLRSSHRTREKPVQSKQMDNIGFRVVCVSQGGD
jgi:formylglycine-generating enzyme required for sulfatase activity